MKRIVVLISGSGSSMRYLVENDPSYGVKYEFVCVIANKKGTKGEVFCREHNINFIEFNTKRFCADNEYYGMLRDMPSPIREGYFRELLGIIKPFRPDLIILSGFMLEITEPLLGYYLIWNVHPADLSICGEDGKPKYTGDDAVTLAISSGEKFTASTIHVVEKEVDCGRIICISDRLPVEEGIDPHDHQEKMKYLCDGPAYKQALEILNSA